MIKKYIEIKIYLKRIDPFIDKDIIKVIVGQRRVGKSYLLFQIMDAILLKHKNPEIIYINKDLLIESTEIFLKYDGTLSLADATSIAVMNNMKINEIISFDSDFDKVDSIYRIHTT